MRHEIYKNIGETPLETINKFKKNYNADKNREYVIKKISYAGRLDPMAKGILLALTNEECYKQNEYHNLQKEYRFDVIIGFSTDTLDILGLVNNISNTEIKDINIEQIREKILQLKEQEYPHYSSVRVNKKPLWYWAKEGKIDTICVPKKNIEIYTFDFIEQKKITESELKNEIFRQISNISQENSSSFRQQEITNQYNKIFTDNKKKYRILTFKTHVSSGVYIRSLTEHIGKIINYKTTAINITRLNFKY